MLRRGQRRAGRCVVAIAMLGLCDCSTASVFACQDDVQCKHGDVVGSCEAGFCAFPDDSCQSGMRYGELSGDLAGQCVALDGDGTDAVTGMTIDATTMPDATTTTGADETTLAISEGSASDGRADATTEGADADSSSDTGVTVDVVRNYVFVSSAAMAPANIGSLQAADAFCQGLADDANLPGTYVAWLSTPTVDARDRLGDAQGWARVDGRPFARSVADLVANDLLYPVRLDETGTDRMGAGVSTATTIDGTYHPTGNCDDFTSPAGSIRRGQSDALGTTLSDSYDGGCDVNTRYYCFGVDDAIKIPVVLEPTARRAFATENTLPASVGLSAFDAQCQGEADAAGLPGRFLALLATTQTPALARFDLNGEPWSLPNDVLIVEQAADLAAPDATLLAPIWRRANGEHDPGGSIFTGSSDPSATTTLAENCSDWTSTAGEAAGGQRARSVIWWGSTSIACTSTRRVLCLQE